jgi:putative phosphoesterase
MKIGVISDTHIPDRADLLPKKVLDAFKTMDMVVHAGDLIDLTVCDMLQAVCKDVRIVCGNMDGKDTAKRFSQKIVITVDKYRIGVMHGWGPPNQLESLVIDTFKKDKVDIIIFGHSHQPCNKKIGDVLMFNPGSATDTVFAPYRSFGTIEISDGVVDAQIVKI